MIVNDIVKKSFPELKRDKILIKESKNKKFDEYFADVTYLFFIKIIRIGKKMSELSKENGEGVLAHELSHIVLFNKRNFIQKMIFGIKYYLSERLKGLEERRTDELAISKGYAKSLYKSRIIRMKDKTSKSNKYYMKPQEIKSYAKKIKKW